MRRKKCRENMTLRGGFKKTLLERVQCLIGWLIGAQKEWSKNTGDRGGGGGYELQ